MKYIVAFDIDGTLLSSKNRFLTSSKVAISRLIEQEHYVVLASSRPPANLKQLSNELGMEGNFILSLNGSFIFQNNKCIFNKNIDDSSVKIIYNLACDFNLHISLYSEFEWFVKEYDKYSKAEQSFVNLEPKVFEYPFKNDLSIQKILIIGDTVKVQEFQRLITDANLKLDATLSKPNYCDIVAKGTSKASGLKFIADRLGLSFKNIIAFGDSENDLEMISQAGIGVVMGNGITMLKEMAGYVTDTNDNDGIYKALVNLKLIEQ